MRCKKHLSDLTSSVGVCSSCLRERLFSLIAAQARADSLSSHPLHSSSSILDLHIKSHHPPPPPLIFPRSVSPYVTRRKLDDRRFHHRFYSTPQVGPTFTVADTDFVNSDSVSRKHNKTRFSLWSNLFRSRSDKLYSISKDSSSSSSSSSWISSIFFGRRKKQSKLSSVVETSEYARKPSRFFSRGMSPARETDRDFDDRGDGSPSASGYSSDSSKWKPSPAMAGSTRRGRQGMSRNGSGLTFCLSPLVRASPNRLWNQKGLPPDLTYSGEVRVQAKPHLSAAASFCANRSRKLADFGRVNTNR